MAHRRYPVAQVDLHTAGFRYAITKAAWSVYRTAKYLADLNAVTSSTEDAATLGVYGYPGSTEIPLVAYNNFDAQDFELFHLSPLLPANHPSTYDTFTITMNDVNGYAEELYMPGIFPAGIYMQSEDETTGFGYLTSKFELCRDGWFRVSLWRGKLERDEEEALDADALTQQSVQWGASAATAYTLTWYHDGTVRLSYGNTGLVYVDLSVSSQCEEGEMLDLLVGVAYGYVVIWDMATGKCSSFRPTEAVATWAPSEITVTIGYGRTWCSISAVKFVAGTLYGRESTTRRTIVSGDTFGMFLGGYDATTNGEETYLAKTDCPWAVGDPEPNWDYGPGVMLDGQRAMGSRYYSSTTVEWMAKMKPWYNTNEFLDRNGDAMGLNTYATPAIASVGISQAAVLTDNGEPAVENDLTAVGGVKDLVVDEPANWGATQVTITMPSVIGGTRLAQAIKDLRLVTISDVGWKLSDGSTSVVADFVRAFTVEPEVAGRTAELPCMDLVTLLNLVKFDGWLPAMDGMNVAYAIAWLLDAVGIGSAWRNIEDLYHAATSTSVGLLSWGSWSKPSWQPRRGTGLISFIRDMLRLCGKNAALWSENGVLTTGCRYCGTQRSGDSTSPNYWANHCDNGWASTGCRAADVARAGNVDGVDVELATAPDLDCDPDTDGFVTRLRAYSRRLDENETANYISVAGAGDLGQEYIATLANATDISDLGFVLARIETDDRVRSSADATDVAAQLYTELAHSSKYISGDVLFHPGIRRGRVVRMQCGAAGDPWNVNNKLYRVVSVNHNLGRSRPYSTFVARWLSA